MKILYISGWHSTLEHDELDVLSKLGHSWFSTGLYADPSNPIRHGYWRDSALSYTPPKDLIIEFKKLNPNLVTYGHVNLTKAFVDKFDLVIMVYCGALGSEFNNVFEFIKHKPIIWRTYAQQSPQEELFASTVKKTSKLTLVRVSETETKLQNSAGIDFAIKGYIDQNLYNNWDGFGGEVLTFNNFFSKRSYVSNTPLYRRIVRRISPHTSSLYGGYNEDSPLCKGKLTNEEQLAAYRNCGVYLSLGSKPAALTYSLQEATMVGCPIVTFGKKLGSSSPSLYEVPNLFENGLDLFMGDSEDELVYYIQLLLTDRSLAQSMSNAVRNKAIKLYSVDTIVSQWDQAIKFAAGK